MRASEPLRCCVENITRQRIELALAQAVTAKRRIGKLLDLVFCLAVFAVFCSTFNARRSARVFFGLRSSGVYFFPLYCFRASAFCFWLYTVRIRAIDLRTTLIFASFDAALPATLATLNCESSFFISSSSFKSSFDVLDRSSYAFTRTIFKKAEDGRNQVQPSATAFLDPIA